MTMSQGFWNRKTKRTVVLLAGGLLLWYWGSTVVTMKEFWEEDYCARNLHSIHTALALYTQDYDQKLPVAAVWMDRTQPYLHSKDGNTRYLFHCPAVRLKPMEYGYAFNRLLSGTPLHAYNTSTIMVYDSQNTRWNATSASPAFATPSRHRPSGKHSFDYALFEDGHITEADSTWIRRTQSPLTK